MYNQSICFLLILRSYSPEDGNKGVVGPGAGGLFTEKRNVCFFYSGCCVYVPLLFWKNNFMWKISDYRKRELNNFDQFGAKILKMAVPNVLRTFFFKFSD